MVKLREIEDGMDKEQAREFVAECKWTFAKSMPDCPHDYIVRSKVDGEKFVALALLIRAKGTVKPWGKYRHVYLELDGFNFWTMGAPIEQTTIINRQAVEDFAKGMPS